MTSCRPKYTLDKMVYLPNDAAWIFINIDGIMKRVNQYFFYQIGMYLHPLSLVTSDTNIHANAWTWNHVRNWIRWLLKNNLVELVVSRSAAESLIKAINNVIPTKTDEFTSIDPDKKLTWSEAYAITHGLEEFETVFAAEMATFDTYIVSKKGIYSTADLIERAELAIDDIARAVMPDSAIRDFNQAGRCLALGLPTAAGYHTMRSVEAVLRKYWRLALSTRKKPPQMAQCIQQLRKHGEDAKVLDILDHIRDLHRNTIMHPEAFLEIIEALRLFDIAKSAISAMGDRIDDLTPIT